VAHFYQFVDTIAASPTVRLDLDNQNPFWVGVGSSVSPPRLRRTVTQGLDDGAVETGSAYEERIIRLELGVELVEAETQSDAIQTLARILDRREGAWLKWQSEGMTEPMFYRTRRASPEVIDDILDARPDRRLMIELAADPFGYGLPVSGSFTIDNDPTTGTNKMMASVPAIQGDVLTPLHLTFDTPDAAHRIQIASQSAFDGTTLTAPYYKSLSAATIATTAASYYDTFTRADSAVSMGVASPGGGTWTAQAGTWGISTNRGYCVTGVAGDWSTAVILFGQADVIAEVTFDTQAANGSAGIVIRSADANTGIAFLGSQAYDIATSGLTALVGPAFTETFVTGDVMRVVAKGSRIDVYRQAAGTGSFSHVMHVTTTLYQANTRHGLVIHGTTAITARFDNFRLGTQLTFGWTITATVDANAVAGTFRDMDSNSGHIQTLVPTSATMQEWADLPPGDYRVMVRIRGANEGVELLFWNRPPKAGSVLMRDEAAATALVVHTSENRDWYDLGVVQMPGGAPTTDPAFGLDGTSMPALWNFGIYNQNNNSMGADAIVLIPAGRPNTITCHSVTAFPDTYTSKTVVLDGVNNRRYAEGENVNLTGTTTRVAPSDMGGALPAVAPGANNQLFFFATAADPASKIRISDDKALDTLVTWKYFPRHVYDRPSP
jgi:hypothetical protein